MTEITGVGISDVRSGGASDNGQFVYVAHQLTNGSEQTLIYPYEAIGHLIAVLQELARMAHQIRVTKNPTEAQEGIATGVVPAKSLELGMSSDHAGPILRIVTADNIPIMVEVPTSTLREFCGSALRMLDDATLEPPSVDPKQRH